MSVKRRRHSAEYKFKVALDAAKGDKTLSRLSVGAPSVGREDPLGH